MGCAHKQSQDGFTLVEISIVMIIIGLLIGGTFGGMKLIENMQVNRTVQDLKAIESAALTFKDAYGRLPGDLRNPSTRLPNCTVAPCATGGNGNRIIENVGGATWNEILAATMEKFTFWHHLQAADLVSMGYSNSTDLNFGVGQPESSVGGGYRLFHWNGAFFNPAATPLSGSSIIITTIASDAIPSLSAEPAVNCGQLASIDRKIDDGLSYMGTFFGPSCFDNIGALTEWGYRTSGLDNGFYNLKGF